MPSPDLPAPLVVRFGAFGDMLLVIPLLKVLHRRYGAPCDLVSSGRWTEPLMQRVPACGPVRLLTSRRAPYWFNRSQWALVDWLRRRPAGPVYVFEPDEKCHWLLRRGGIRPEWICTMRDLPRRPNESIMHHALRLGRETPAALQGDSRFAVDPAYQPDARPVLSAADLQDCAEWIASRGLAAAPLVLLQPGNKKTMKGGNRTRRSNVDYWPESHWAELIGGLHGHLPAARIIICGAPSERPLAEDIAALVRTGRDRVVIATDDLPVARLLALQARAHSMISVNTGPAHGAATMGCPLVALFTRHQRRAPDLYMPQATTAPVKVIFPDATEPDAALATVLPATVLAAWQRMVAALPPGPRPPV